MAHTMAHTMSHTMAHTGWSSGKEELRALSSPFGTPNFTSAEDNVRGCPVVQTCQEATHWVL